MKHLEVLARQIAARNVRHIFGIPGSGPSLYLLDRLEKQGVRFHLTHFEGSAALMAGAIGKLSGRSGVALSIKGPGLTNMLPGLAACSLESFPVVSISEAYLPETSPASAHKRIDHIKLLSAIAKYQSGLTNQGPHFDRLAQKAETEVPGVVHLNIAATPFENPTEEDILKKKKDAAKWEEAQRLLDQCHRPVVIAGSLAVRHHFSKHFNALSIPVFSTAAAKGVIDERRPHAAGVYTGVGGPLSPENGILPQADLIVAVGLRHNEVLAARPFDCPSIHIDPLGDDCSFGFKFSTRVEGAASQTEKIFAGLSEKQWGLGLIEKSRQRLNKKLDVPSFLPATVYRCIADHFKSEARLVLDTGDFCTIGEHAWAVSRADLYLASGQGRYMGVGLPLGIGAAIYDSHVPTVVFTGDGGIGMFISEIKLALHHNLPLLLVLLTDAHLGSIRGSALQKGLTQLPTVIARPSWVKILEGYGVSAARAENVDHIEKNLAIWKQDGPLFLEIPFDADEYQNMTDGFR